MSHTRTSETFLYPTTSNVHIVSTLDEARKAEREEISLSWALRVVKLLLQCWRACANAFLTTLRWTWFRGVPERNGAIANIVVYMNGTLGDHVVHLPSIAALKNKYTSAALTLVSWSGDFPMADFLPAQPYIDAIVSLNEHPVIRQGFRFRFSHQSLSSLKCDLFINLSPFGNRGVPGFVLREMIFAKKIHARYALGFHMFSLGRQGILNRLQHYFVVNEPRRAGIMLRPLGLPEVSANEVLPLNADARASIESKIHRKDGRVSPIVVLNPGAKFMIKCWPAERFAALGAWMSKELNARIVITGIASERKLGDDIVLSSGGCAENLAGETSMLELIELLRMSSLCVTNDTGTMHVAALLGKPIVAIFGTRISPTHWFPKSGQVRALFSFGEASYSFSDEGVADESVRSIQVDDVKRAVTELFH